jgi:hypothetical protein
MMTTTTMVVVMNVTTTTDINRRWISSDAIVDSDPNPNRKTPKKIDDGMMTMTTSDRPNRMTTGMTMTDVAKMTDVVTTMMMMTMTTMIERIGKVVVIITGGCGIDDNMIEAVDTITKDMIINDIIMMVIDDGDHTVIIAKNITTTIIIMANKTTGSRTTTISHRPGGLVVSETVTIGVVIRTGVVLVRTFPRIAITDVRHHRRKIWLLWPNDSRSVRIANRAQNMFVDC